MQNTVPPKNIGIITGGWCGLEVVDAASLVLQAIEEISNIHFSPYYFSYENWKDTETKQEKFYACVKEFYQDIKIKGGWVLRGSLHAPIVYKLREDFNQLYKLVPLKYSPELLESSLLKEDVAEKIDFLIVRENCHGPYHAQFSSEQLSETNRRRVSCTFHYDQEDIDNFADVAFNLASNRSKKLHLFIKDESMGELGELWLDSFKRSHLRYPNVDFAALPMGSGAAEIFYKPREFDVIATPDVEGDILADNLTRLIYGSTMTTASGNFSLDGFASYQTIHGTVKPIAGKDKINPIGMIQALAMCLEYSANMTQEAQMIKDSIRRTLVAGFRTIDIYRTNNHKLIGTKEMTQRIIDNLIYPA